MNIKPELGSIVWHDLMTNELDSAKEFYTELLGWNYHIEHSDDFAWRPGEEADYPLIIANGEAHGGFVDPGKKVKPYWLAWVQVNNVDDITDKAKKSAAKIEHPPFDITGVGRGSVIEDPQGAMIGPFIPSHGFPPPSGVFLWDEIHTDDTEAAKNFYSDLFKWSPQKVSSEGYTIFKSDNGSKIAGIPTKKISAISSAGWVPYLATSDVEAAIKKAHILGAKLLFKGTDIPNSDHFAILTDPVGAVFGLMV